MYVSIEKSTYFIHPEFPVLCAMMTFPPIEEEVPESLVSFHFEDVTFDLPEQQPIEDWLLAVAATEEKPFIEVNYIFCSDEHLRGMNVEFLDHDYYTDVITFPYTAGAVHGDIFISIDRVRDNALQLDVSFDHELCRVLVHGVLHLAGYLDKTPEEEQLMRAREDFYLQRIFPENKR